MSESEILRTLDRIWERSNVRTAILGRLGREGGTVEDIEVRGRPGYVYVSVGDLGDQGLNIAKDKVGVARVLFQQVKMRRELGELVIYEAAAYAGGTGNGGGEPGATSIFELTDVQPTGWDTGEVMMWNATSGKFTPALPGTVEGSYIEGDGIFFNGNIINAKAHPTRGIIVDSGGIGVNASDGGGLEADQITGELRIKIPDNNSGLILDIDGLQIEAGDGISLSANGVDVNVAEIYNPMKGLIDVAGDLEVKPANDSGLGFGPGGGLLVGAGQGIKVEGGLTSIFVTESDPAGIGFNTDDDQGLMITEGAGIEVQQNGVAVRLSSYIAGLVFVEDFDSIGHLSLAVGAGDGIKAEYGETSVDVVELISPDVFGIGHDGLNNFIVALEPNSGLRYNDPSGKLELGAPGDLDVFSVSQLINDTHYHHVATSSNPGSTAKIMATDAEGGFNFDSNLLLVDGANRRVGINRIPTDATFGSAALDLIVANIDDITQRIKRVPDQRGRLWRIEDEFGGELIVLDSVGNLQSGNPGFVSGMLGWQITPTGNAEFNNIWARGELHATVFVKDEIHATGGTFMVATAATFYEDAQITDSGQGEVVLEVDTNPTGSVGFGPLEIVSTSINFVGTTLHTFTTSNIIKLNHPPSGKATYFQPGEILRVKTEINEEGNPLRLADIWMIINQGDASNDEYGSYSVNKVSGSNATIPKGTAIVTYGKPGDGAILMTSDWRDEQGTEDSAPYIDIFTTGEEPWLAQNEGITPHVRLGQLRGVGLPGVSGINKFGLIAGTDLADPNSSYMMASGDGVEIYRGLIRLSNGANTTGLWDQNGNFKLGKNVTQPSTTGFEVITTAGDPNEGDVFIGNRNSTNYLHWNALSGILTVTGSLQVGGGSGFAQTSYVDDQDDLHVIEATDYADDLFDGISGDWEAYTDSRRMTSIAGSWTSSAYNVVKWGVPAGSPGTGLTVYFGNNTSRTIADSAAAGLTILAGRTYLYVNIDASAAPTALVMQTTQNPNVINLPGEVLIAVADRGVNDALNQGRASINVMVGSTYISGGNIFTSSILADSIASDAITAIKINSLAIETRHMSAEVMTMLGGRSVQGIEGRLVPHTTDKDRVDWSNVALGTGILVVRLSNDAVLTISQGTRTIVSRDYAYVRPRLADDTSYTLLWASDVASLPVDAIVIAVARYTGSRYGVSVVMTTGATVLSGDDILTGTLHASKIVTGSIAVSHTVDNFFDANNAELLGQMPEAATEAMKPFTIVAMNGKIEPLSPPTTANHGDFDWPQLSIRYANDTTRTVPAGSYTMTGTLTATSRVYFYVKANEANSVVLWKTQTFSSVPGDGILLAVGEYGSEFSSCTMLYGGVFISGNSILAGSITSNEIKANSIDVGDVNAQFFTTANNNAAKLATDEVYSKTIIAVNGKLSPDPANNGRITWPQLTIRFAGYPTKPDRVVPSSASTAAHVISGAVGTRGYFWIEDDDLPSTPLHGSTTMTSVPANGMLIATGELGATHTTVTMTFGGVTISGNHILTGSLTAGQISVETLEAFNTTTGSLTVDGTISLGKTTSPTAAGVMVVNNQGKIYSGGMTSPGSASGGGFFLGYEGGTNPGYKFYVGKAADYMRYDPVNGLDFESNNALILRSTGAGDTSPADIISTKVFNFVRVGADPLQSDLSLWHSLTGIRANGDWEFLANVTVEKLDINMAAGTNPADYAAITFTKGGLASSIRYNEDGAGRLNFLGTGGLKLNGPLWVSGNGSLAIDGRTINLGMTPIGDMFDSQRPGSVGEIRISTGYLYVHIGGTNGWRRISLGDEFGLSG